MRRRSTVTTLIAASTLIASISLQVSGDQSAAEDTQPPPVLPSPVPGGDPLSIQGFADSQRISLEEAAASFDIVPMGLDFQATHAQDPGFGAVWFTYDNGEFQVHVRLVDDHLSTEVDRFEEAIGRSIARRMGGSSYTDLHGAAEKLFTEAPHVSFQLNDQHGVISLSRTEDVALVKDLTGLPTEHLAVRDTPEPRRDLLESHAGDIYYTLPSGAGSYVPQCTVGYMLRHSTGGAGAFATAGHCPDGNAYVTGGTYSNSPTPVWEQCSPLDIQITYAQPYAGYPKPGHLFRTYGSPAFSDMKYPGGYAVGQQALAVGRITGATWGTVTSFGNHWVSGTNSECPNPGNRTGLLTTHSTKTPGDSGGPVLLAYNGWYLSAIMSAGSQVDLVSSWISFAWKPSNYQVCNQNYNCPPF